MDQSNVYKYAAKLTNICNTEHTNWQKASQALKHTDKYQILRDCFFQNKDHTSFRDNLQQELQKIVAQANKQTQDFVYYTHMVTSVLAKSSLEIYTRLSEMYTA